MSKGWSGILSCPVGPTLKQSLAESHRAEITSLKCSMCLNCHHYIKRTNQINESYPALPTSDLLSAWKNVKKLSQDMSSSTKLWLLSFWSTAQTVHIPVNARPRIAPAQWWRWSKNCSVLTLVTIKTGNLMTPWQLKFRAGAIPTPLCSFFSTYLWEGEENQPSKGHWLLQSRNKPKPPQICKRSHKKSLHSSRAAPMGTLLHLSCFVSDAKAHFAPSVKDLLASAARFYITEVFDLKKR